jgi:hypothetical protein
MRASQLIDSVACEIACASAGTVCTPMKGTFSVELCSPAICGSSRSRTTLPANRLGHHNVSSTGRCRKRTSLPKPRPRVACDHAAQHNFEQLLESIAASMNGPLRRTSRPRGGAQTRTEAVVDYAAISPAIYCGAAGNDGRRRQAVWARVSRTTQCRPRRRYCAALQQSTRQILVLPRRLVFNLDRW